MVSDWVAFGAEVLKFWCGVFVEAFYRAWGFVGQTREGIMFAILVLIAFFIYLLRRHGWKGLWGKFWEKVAEGVAIALIAFTVVFAWKLFAEPWSEVSWANHQTGLALAAKRSALLRNNGDEATIDQQMQEIASLRAALPTKGYVESPNSLRRRTIKLANDLDQYVELRWNNHPNRSCEGQNINTATEEQKKAIEECRKYDNETANYINSHFKDKWTGIVRECAAKGVKTGFLENDMEQNHPAQNTMLPFWPSINDGNYQSAQAKFRELAYHVDAQGNRVDIEPAP